MIVSVGKQFIDSWQGQVHSVFTHSVNLLPVEASAPSMLTLLCGDHNMSERCLALSEDTTNRLFPLLTPGMPVICREHTLTFPQLDVQPLCFTRFIKKAWLSPIPPALDKYGISIMAEMLPASFRTLHRLESHMDSMPLRTTVIMRFEAFVSRFFQIDPTYKNLLNRLIGAGPGLTPSGDDLLVGLCCALHGVDHPLFEILCELLPSSLPNTTIVSRLMLEDAVRGYFHRPLAELRQALLTGKSQTEVNTALRRAAEFGASSGCDGARGLLVGLQHFQKEISYPGPVSGIQPASMIHAG